MDLCLRRGRKPAQCTVDSTRIEGRCKRVDLMMVCADGQKWVDAEDLLFLLHDGRCGRGMCNGVFFEIVQWGVCVESCGEVCEL